MMEREELVQWAIRGISEEIYELDRKVRKGKGYLTDYYLGKQPKTKKSQQEIEQIVNEKQKQIAELEKKRNDLQWEFIEREE